MHLPAYLVRYMKSQTQPPQHQDSQPGKESHMDPVPVSDNPQYRGSHKLKDKVALITGGDSGIGKAVSIIFAKEGADIFIVYYDEHQDAEPTKKQVEKYGRKCYLFPGDISDPHICVQAVDEIQKVYGQLNILINNAAVQFPQENFADISPEQLQRTFATNIFSYFYMTQAALKHLHAHDSIINTTSVTAYRGSEHLIDYSATKGAIVSFTRSLAKNLVSQQIRVNAVAPGPIWTPLIPATFPSQKVSSFGSDTPMGRAGQPAEVAPSYVFLASADSSYITGQVLHPNGGEMVES